MLEHGGGPPELTTGNSCMIIASIAVRLQRIFDQRFRLQLFQRRSQHGRGDHNRPHRDPGYRYFRVGHRQHDQDAV